MGIKWFPLYSKHTNILHKKWNAISEIFVVMAVYDRTKMLLIIRRYVSRSTNNSYFPCSSLVLFLISRLLFLCQASSYSWKALAIARTSQNMFRYECVTFFILPLFSSQWNLTFASHIISIHMLLIFASILGGQMSVSRTQYYLLNVLLTYRFRHLSESLANWFSSQSHVCTVLCRFVHSPQPLARYILAYLYLGGTKKTAFLAQVVFVYMLCATCIFFKFHFFQFPSSRAWLLFVVRIYFLLRHFITIIVLCIVALYVHTN